MRVRANISPNPVRLQADMMAQRLQTDLTAQQLQADITVPAIVMAVNTVVRAAPGVHHEIYLPSILIRPRRLCDLGTLSMAAIAGWSLDDISYIRE